tara:strand:- start:99 stop:461 length:363 start_codon:yes stop_codon:yes gene_type:complete
MEDAGNDLKNYLKTQAQHLMELSSATTKLSADLEWLFMQLNQTSLSSFCEGLIVALDLDAEQSELVRRASKAKIFDLSPESYKKFIETYIQALEKEAKKAMSAQAETKSQDLESAGVNFE